MLPLPDRIAQATALLHPLAVPVEGILGRERDEAPDQTRFPFQRDRGRIIHASAFRRLKGKTQVFVTGEGDHYRTRLTHTLEVAEIARDIARTLALNEDLAECIALAHDLGHPPFGHAGEAALDEWMQTHDLTFEHNLQSHRIVTVLERHASTEAGLNLNREVLQGLLKHTEHGHTLEAQLVNIADEIAYTSHDAEDGLREGLLTDAMLTATDLGSEARAKASVRGTSLRGALIELLVTDLYAETEALTASASLRSVRNVLAHDSPLVAFSAPMRQRLNDLRRVLWTKMYMHPSVETKTREGKAIVHAICTALFASPTDKVVALMEQTGSTTEIAVKDYVAGMTDGFARDTAAGLRKKD